MINKKLFPKYKKKSCLGFLLLELLIAISILSISLPSIYKTYLQTQNKITKMHVLITNESEFRYIETIFQEDLRSFQKEIETNKLFAFTTITNETIKYNLKNNKIQKEKIKAGKTKGAIYYLNDKLTINTLNINKISNNEIQITIGTEKSGQREIKVFLVNAK
jgi:type II secretory pathway pseudopilin PulG